MAIGMLAEVPGGTEQQYDAAIKELNLGGRPAEGMILHVAGPAKNGWYVMEVWESREAFDRFCNDRLQRALQKVGMWQPKMTFFPVHNMLTERYKAMGR